MPFGRVINVYSDFFAMYCGTAKQSNSAYIKAGFYWSQLLPITTGAGSMPIA
jgi:hypothetical protein